MDDVKRVRYGDWEIVADIAKTKKYYADYVKKDTEANRNFAKYCKRLSEEETQFFDSFGIDPMCCNIEHIGVDKKGNFPCGGYYYVCGEYAQRPPENLITPEELEKNDFVDERADPRVYIGLFQFDFQCEDYKINEIPEDIPQGFICIRFWCEDMKWLLDEPCTEKQYDPPRFWEIHRMIRKKTDYKKQMAAEREESRRQLAEAFENIGVTAVSMKKREAEKYKYAWLRAFATDRSNLRELRKTCMTSHGDTTFLWHVFGIDIRDCQEGRDAVESFETQDRSKCVLLNNIDISAYDLTNADKIDAEFMNGFDDAIITANDFSWTYIKTDEVNCGPFFYKGRRPTA